MSWMIFILYP
jgi:hypothetical protein